MEQQVIVPRPEHPRPDLQRDPWINLNGRWRFSFDPQNIGEQLQWYRVPHPAGAKRIGEVIVSIEDPFGSEITVPFPWESRLSGVFETAYKGAAWYQRSIEVPTEWAQHDAPSGLRDAGGLPSAEDSRISPTAPGASVRWRRRPFLCFGAVDWNAKVWVNGRFVAEHDGGYTPFTLDLSRYVRPGRPATLTVRVWDACDADTPLGKQSSHWYTHSGGIWQTVWLEGRPAAYLSWIHITPHLAEGRAAFSARIAATPEMAGSRCRLTVTSADSSFPAVEQVFDFQAERTDMAMGVATEITTEASVEVQVPQPRPWSPEDPHLYPCTVSLVVQRADVSPGTSADQDEISTYFGLRAIATGRWDGRPYEFIFLNGEPIYLRGALDQAFHPEGVHTYPSDDAIRADIQAAKDLGLNMLRCHIKVNESRYYYWADKLGVLIMYDLPSASIYTPKARANWEWTFRDALERDYSHPSIFAWVLFNETWGLEEHKTPASWMWVQQMYQLAKQLDPTRLVEDNSAYLYDHVATDINTWHFYIGDYDRARRHIENVVSQTHEGSPFHYVGGVYGDVQGAEAYKQGTQPLLNSEYAGISAWQGDRDISYTFKFLTTELRRHDIICGYVYTELTDVEWEHNGLLNYDRTHKEFGYDAFIPEMRVADLNGADFVGLDCPPCQTLLPGSTFTVPAFVSHWDKRELSEARLHWRVTAIDHFGETCSVSEGQRSVQPRRYGVVPAGDIETRLPDEACLVTVAVWLEDGAGEVRARNYVNVDVPQVEHAGIARWSQSAPPMEKMERGYALHFLPGDFVSSGWQDTRIGPRGSKFGAAGAGWVEYAVDLPAGNDFVPAAVHSLRLRFEASARTSRNRISWKDPVHTSLFDYPQTEAQKIPSAVVVSINGIRLGIVQLPDDPADARGVLSAYLSDTWEYASYGFLTTLHADATLTRRILAASRQGKLMIRFEVPRDGFVGGLNLYGARMGAYPVDPTVFLDT